MRNLLSLVFLVSVVACVAPDASDEASDDATPDDQASVDEAISANGIRHLSCTLSGTSDRVASDFNYTTDRFREILPTSVKWNTCIGTSCTNPPRKLLDKISWAWLDSSGWQSWPSVGGTTGSHNDVETSGTVNASRWTKIPSGSMIRMTVWGQSGKCSSVMTVN